MKILLKCLLLNLLLAPAVSLAEAVAPGVLRTPDSRFENLQGYQFTPHYMDIQGLRIHYLDEGPKTETLSYCYMESRPGVTFFAL